MSTQLSDAEKNILDAWDKEREIYEQVRDEGIESANRIKDAIVNTYQKEIDALEKIHDSIDDANSKLISSMRSAIDKARRDRENDKTAESIAQKQRRLAYLKQDTTGANALTIKQLEKEIKDEQQNYQDTLVDQKLEDMEDNLQKAEEQRDQQIDLMNAQLQAYQASNQI